MINDPAKNRIAEAVILQNILIHIKAKSPKLYAKIKRDYQRAIDGGGSFNTTKMLTDILEP